MRQQTLSPRAIVEAELIHTTAAAAAVGPYSQAIRSGRLLFISGQIPLDPATGNVISDDISAQTHLVFQNLGAILEAADSSFEDIVRTTVFLVDLSNFAAMNDVYATYFCPPAPAPARSTMQVAALPKDVCLMIDAIAVLPRPSSTRSTDLP